MHECSAAAAAARLMQIQKSHICGNMSNKEKLGEAFRVTGLKRENPGSSLVPEEVKIPLMSHQRENPRLTHQLHRASKCQEEPQRREERVTRRGGEERWRSTLMEGICGENQIEVFPVSLPVTHQDSEGFPLAQPPGSLLQVLTADSTRGRVCVRCV